MELNVGDKFCIASDNIVPQEKYDDALRNAPIFLPDWVILYPMDISIENPFTIIHDDQTTF